MIKTFATGPIPLFPPPYNSSLHSSGPATHPIILLLNAILTQRRVLFLGHGIAANKVARFVLAACALGTGGGSVLRGLQERAFCYANLAGLETLEEV